MRRLTHSELLLERHTANELQTMQRHPIVVVLQDVRSRYNVGSIFRSADAFRIHELILTGYTPAPPSTEISKTALGSVDTVPFRKVQEIHDVLDSLESNGFTLCAVELTTPTLPISELQPTMYPLAMILGNELDGVSADVLERCTTGVHIPMYGIKHSLNVAVAAGIAMYEAVRQKP